MGAHQYQLISIGKKFLFAVLAVCLWIVAFGVMGSNSKVSAAACVAPTTDYGTVTQTVNITTGGSYRVWSRMKASSSDANANSYLVEIDGNTCFTVGDDSSITSGAWKWIDYQSGSTTNKINHTFTAGNHTIKMIGREAGVQLDRLLFLSPTDTCITNSSTGNGDACTVTAPPSNTPPTVSVSAPSNGATFTAPASITINANASDSDGTISKVEFFQGTTKLGEDITSPYSYSWSNVAAGSYSITAKATDNGGATTSSSVINVTVGGTTTGSADLVVTNVTWSPASPAVDQQVTFSVTVKNQGSVATDKGAGVLFMVDGQPQTWVRHDSTSAIAAGQSVTYTANGGVNGTNNEVSTWTAVSGSHTVEAHVDDLGLITESNNDNNTLSKTINVGTTTSRPEDINEDGSVNLLDFVIFKSKYGQSGPDIGRSDINGDGTVNLLDFVLFKQAYGS